jgi:hypothetical protein
MSHDNINSWVEKAKQMEALVPETEGVQVIRRVAMPNRGNLIMQVADKIYPWLMEMFQGIRDENGMLPQPARVRGIALNVAQDIIKRQG